MSEHKPPTQRVVADGFDGFKPMGAEDRRPAHEVLRELAKLPRFQSYAAREIGHKGPMTPTVAIECVFSLIGARSWSELAYPDQLARFQGLLDRYSAEISRAT